MIERQQRKQEAVGVHNRAVHCMLEENSKVPFS